LSEAKEMSFAIPEATSYVILYCVLILFALTAAASADLFGHYLPSFLRKVLVLMPINDEESIRSPDFFLSARDSSNYLAIALSYFAGGMGSWVVYGTTEMGANPALSWLGIIGYSGASAFPAIVISYIGPHIRKMSTSAFSATDFAKERYGRVMQLCSICISVFYMFIYLVAELTTISNVYGLLVGKNVFADSSLPYTISISCSVGLITIFYTGLAGLPGSITTDKIQGVIMIGLVLILLFSFVNPENHVSKQEFSAVSNWTMDGFIAAVTLFLAIMSAEMFNQGTWQRVWAAKSTADLRVGFCVGSVLVFLLMMIFGVFGMIAYAKDPSSYDNYDKLSFLSFFDFVETLGSGWHVTVLFLITALCASTVDTLQNALTSVLSSDLLRLGLNNSCIKWISRLLVLLINVPAIYLSAMRFDVISLFLVADLACATSVFPVFLGLMEQDYKFLTAPTELGAFLGCLAGFATVIVNGIINGTADDGIFAYFWLQNGDICALCGTKTMTTFIVTPLISAFCTMLFSKIHVMICGEKARSPIFGCSRHVNQNQVQYETPTKNIPDATPPTKDDDFVSNPDVDDVENANVENDK